MAAVKVHLIWYKKSARLISTYVLCWAPRFLLKKKFFHIYNRAGNKGAIPLGSADWNSIVCHNPCPPDTPLTHIGS